LIIEFHALQDALMIKQCKIVIVGAGLVGGSAALFTAYSIPGIEVVLIDLEPVRAEGQVLDLLHAAAIWRSAHFYAGDYSDARDADIVVITAGAGVKPGQTRLDIAQINARIVRDIVDQISRYASDPIYVIATNPCDVLAHVVFRHLNLPRERIISTGTELDTARLRTLLSERLGIVASAIHAYVLGEHGASAVIHWSGATVSGMPLDAFLSQTGKELGTASRDLMLRSVHESAKLIKEGKGATHYGIASAIARICQAIIHNSSLILSVAIVHREVEGIPDVCLSLPTLVNARGANVLAYPLLNEDESEGLRRSAQIIKSASDRALMEPKAAPVEKSRSMGELR
jgi:L-lactate dehydrogenase